MSSQVSASMTSMQAGGVSAASGTAMKFLIAGGVFFAGALGLLFMGSSGGDPRAFLGFLIGASFWLSICIGMLFIIQIFWIFDAGWSVIVRRQMENFLGAFKWLALVYLPLMAVALFMSDGGGVPWLWMNPDALVPGGHGSVSHDVLYLHKAPYLSTGFFFARYVLYFAIWIGIAEALRRWSYKVDETGDARYVRASRYIAAVGIPLTALATTGAAIDWFKSLEYHWFSTMYGVWFFAACMRAALSATLLICFFLARQHSDGLRGIFKPAHGYLIACIMLAFTIFWAYISFCQYFLIYSANIPEETFWYNMREISLDGTKNSWWWVSMSLIFLHFLFPFIWLLWYNNKFSWRIQFIAVWILVLHVVDLYWNILPTRVLADNILGYTVRPLSLHLSELLAFIGVGGICIWSFLNNWKSHKIIPIRDPRIMESINAHE